MKIIRGHKSSPALEQQGEHYPPEWKGRVPAQAKIIKRVRGLRLGEDQPLLVLHPGDEVELYVNIHGASSGWVSDAENKIGGTFLLGLKPDEFEITGWYAELLLCEPEICTSGLRDLVPHSWHCPECNVHLTNLYLCDRCNKRWYPYLRKMTP